MADLTGAQGEELNLLPVRQGATFGPHTITMTNPDGSPVNVTGWLFRGQIRKTASDATVAAMVMAEVVNGPGGVWRFWISDEATAALQAGDSVMSAQSQYVWDLEAELPDGTVRAIFFGTVQVFREVTR